MVISQHDFPHAPPSPLDKHCAPQTDQIDHSHLTIQIFQGRHSPDLERSGSCCRVGPLRAICMIYT